MSQNPIQKDSGREKIARSIAGRLSLRQPQTDSLDILHNALEAVPALRDSRARSPDELKAMQTALTSQFPTLTDFEREFPSMCFALATGVGKTRLMGAFISYLYAAYGYKHFFVLAPNLTIYDKLIQDFTPNTPKYVFKGIAEFATAVPEVITGETYEQRGDLVSQSIDAPVQVNIFNISKINSEVRGGKAPKIKRLSEYLGQSYFDYLAGLPDLVLIMDESHRYRAGAGIRAINELKPLIGLEVTATPFTEGTGGKTVPFKNVVMDYPLARAIEDGFVKEPAVVTQQNFNPADHNAEQIEVIKLKDGVRVHEETKVHLLTYAAQTGLQPVKPFVLVIARDTTHAAQLLTEIESSSFFGGNYKGKVIQVDSSRTGADEEEMIRRLLTVESYHEPTEIVIHVNMLKEGWDVTNLYTIVPLRAANARTLIEQSIGRGLRLPYGRKTGVEVVDRLNIIAHDKFQEVIAEANKGDSPIRLKQLKLDPTDSEGNRLTSYAVPSTMAVVLGLADVKGTGVSGKSFVPGSTPDGTQKPGDAPQTVSHITTILHTGEDRQIALTAMDVIAEVGRDKAIAPTSASLSNPSVQEHIAKLVQQRLVPQQGELLGSKFANAEAVAAVVKQAVDVFVEHTIDIPRISVVPVGPVKSGYTAFKLDISRLNYQSLANTLESHGLQSNKVLTYGEAAVVEESRFEDYIVRELINFDDVSYDEHADFIYQLADQAVEHFKSYLTDDDALHNVLANYAKPIAEIIHTQLAKNYVEESGGSDVVVSQGFVPLKACAFTAKDDLKPLHWAPDDKRTISQYLYGGFARCAYPYQKFHSDTERILATVLERQAIRWFRPASGQFNIYYRSGATQPEYIPDFVACMDDVILMIETKKAQEVTASQESETDVRAKAEQAVLWCKNASDYSKGVDGKPWRYLLIPHDAVAANITLENLILRYSV
ncbi:MAG: DEAD/DEAH box helicase family protein [Anaerolineales bacterium]|nr:DEAD/DEAH box helicase family protein [Anaerolineales bacterium]